MQFEGVRPRYHRSRLITGPGFRRQLVKASQPTLDRGEKPVLLCPCGPQEMLPALLKLGIRFPHAVDHGADYLHQRRFAAPHQPRMSDRPPQDASQDISRPALEGNTPSDKRKATARA